MFNNLGNLETASGNVTESQEYFEKASQIWKEGGDATATHLALTYLCMGRMHMLRLDLKEAERMTQLAESLFIRTVGKANKGFLALYSHPSSSFDLKLIRVVFTMRKVILRTDTSNGVRLAVPTRHVSNCRWWKHQFIPSPRPHTFPLDVLNMRSRITTLQSMYSEECALLSRTD